jgi:transposase
MEACASSHFWARKLTGLGFEVVLLPPHYVRPYVRRNKTDRTDCEALLEALRCGGIHPVSIKSEDQQAVAALHRVRSQWMATRTARINGARALLREFGIACPTGADRFLGELPRLLDEKKNQVPSGIRHTVLGLWEEVRALEERVSDVEGELKRLCAEQPTLQALLQISGIGVLTATALWASVGSVHTFKSGRHLASWLGLTPRESSSGSRRRLGGISKQGDPYLRMLLIHGARSALRAAQQRDRAGKPLTRLQQWAVTKAQTQHFNSAAVALANKLARIVWAVWHYERSFIRRFGKEENRDGPFQNGGRQYLELRVGRRVLALLPPLNCL